MFQPILLFFQNSNTSENVNAANANVAESANTAVNANANTNLAENVNSVVNSNVSSNVAENTNSAVNSNVSSNVAENANSAVNTNANTIDKSFEATQAASNTIVEMVNGFFAQLPLIGVGIVVFIIFIVIAYGVRKVVKATALKAQLDAMLASLLARISYIITIVIGLFIASTVIFPGIKPGDLIAGLGIGSVALGFAFKDVLQNLFAGFLILLYRPFKIGDQIKIDDFEGDVEEINVRATKIKTYDGERVVIPNNELYMKSVLVRTAFPSRRTKITVGIGYGESHEKAREILMEVLEKTEGVLETPAPDVNVVELADSSVNLKMLYWTDPFQSSTRKTADRVVSATKAALDEAGIEIPFPQRVVEVVNKPFKIETSSGE